ncbi:MAG: LPS export ABC transporter permease LptG [Legionella sp.]|nr:MAG: LPS export ABC transporter permease LptG [Legionella sp.]
MTKILDRYIAKTVLSSIALITLMLAGLQIFILFVDQLGDMGKVDFGFKQVAFYVLLQMPYQLYLFFPMASLLGCLIGLGMMANHSELIVMRAAGMSIGQITLAVLKASILVIVLVTTLGETMVPWLSRQANDIKSAALSGGQSIRTSQGMWLRYEADFISISSIQNNLILEGVYQFRFDPQHNLKLARAIREVHYIDNQWVAFDVQETLFTPEKTQVKTISRMLWDVSVKPQILKISSNEPDEMTLHEINRYVREQKRNQLNAQNYKFAFLQRLIQPLTTMVMMVLAIPFIFGPLRSSTMGSKLLVGATVGFGFNIMNRFVGPISMVYQWPPEIAALAPTLLFALLGIYLMRRVI